MGLFKKAVKPTTLHRYLSPKLRFELQVEKRAGCWGWSGATDQNGYGRVKVHGQHTYAHRFSYEYYVGPVPDGHVIRHLCHNPECTNPRHLTTGTVSQNVMDSVRDGRAYVGEKNPNAKLTRKQVLELCAIADELKARGKRVNKSALGRRFGITNAMAGRIIRREAWTHLWEDNNE